MVYSVNYFHRLHQALFTFNISHLQFHGTRTDIISFTFIRNLRPFLPRISLNSSVLNSTMSKSVVPEFTNIGQATSKARVDIYSSR